MLILSGIAKRARVVELADSLASGASARKGVRVQLPPRAPIKGHPFGWPFIFCAAAIFAGREHYAV